MGTVVFGCAFVTILVKFAIVAIVIPVAMCALVDARDVETRGRRENCRDASVAFCFDITVGSEAIFSAAAIFSVLPLGCAMMCGGDGH